MQSEKQVWLLVRRPFIPLVTGSFSGTICVVGGSGWGRLVLMKRIPMWVADVWSRSTGMQRRRLGNADRHWWRPAYGEAGTTKSYWKVKATFSVTTPQRCEGNSLETMALQHSKAGPIPSFQDREDETHCSEDKINFWVLFSELAGPSGNSEGFFFFN